MPTRQTSESREKFNQLKALLREMFQLDRGDLDFGLYRIMNMMADKITKFLDNDLLPQVKTILAGVSDEDRADLEKHVEDARAMAKSLGINPDDAPKVIELERQLAEAKTDAEAEADVYGYLANFFSRYYSEGDFMSLRRYSGGGDSAYHIPYDGEEVKLHWANADQYYIKTAENYASYAFTLQKNRHVKFETVAADSKKDNIKETSGRQRRFVLVPGKGAIVHADETLIVRFEHRPLTDSEKKKFPGNGDGQQNRINQATTERILQNLNPDWRACLSELEPTGANSKRTKLEKHVERYTAKNSFDYFIHKDLGGFLRREMDFYLKSDVFNLNDINASNMVQLRRAQLRVRATREMGEKIISFLEQLENFQKKLWLKKKFVLDTHWCATLDHVPETFYAEIAANERQVEEWKELFAINEIDGSLSNDGTGYSDPLTIGFLKANPYLILDTRHFDRDFTDRLLATLSEIGPLDAKTDGVFVHGENFQALNLLKKRYHSQVECVYIDPPYNTGDSEILYKNGYLKSSWLTLMANRLALLPEILTQDLVLYIAIDDFEMVDLAKLLDEEYPSLRRETIIVNHHPQGGKAQTLAHTHEYMLACVPTSSSRTLVGRTGHRDEEQRPFRRSGTAESNFRYARPNSFYAILVDPSSRQVVGLEPPPIKHEYPTEPTDKNLVRIYPIGAQGEERVWRKSYKSCQALVDGNKLCCSKSNTIYQRINADERKTALFSNWTDSRYNAGTFGANLLSDITGAPNQFSYPKSIHTVEDAIFAANLNADAYILDYFAGSGTTGHAIINLNRENNTHYKYLMVEMADHFDAVLLPRIKKIIYSPGWEGGKPASRDEGISQLFKYIRLESYEDTLDGLVWKPKESDLFADNPALSEDYQLRYSLNVETQNSTNLLGMDCLNPFACTISTVRDGVRQDVPVDLPETFNHLIGLHVHSYQKIDDVLSITGTDSQKRNCLILWRNLEKTDNAKLEKWFDLNRKLFPDSLALVYVNGDHTLNAIRGKKDIWTAKTIEPVFRALMFEDCSYGK
ncbi:MAG: DNA methyltransferase [Gammaproteobacteria bacterium]|nr:DNA methyltransferase [Gammaproteobacteria bacterium]